jgi:GNAT superfamily N-acetyltransferase
MELVACEPARFTNDELRTEAGEKTDQDAIVFRAIVGGDEVALVILSLPEGLTEAELDKLYVPSAARKSGIASRALQRAEDYCRQQGRTLLTLWANPLDDDTDQEWLINWYRRRGYVDGSGGYGELEKKL